MNLLIRRTLVNGYELILTASEK